jgi:hypothetical protein
MLPLNATQPNFGRGLADLEQVLACCIWGEEGACRAGMSVEPIRHFGLVFSGGVLISEYVWGLASLAVVKTGCGALAMLWGSPWDAEGVPEEPVFIGDRIGRACNVCPSRKGLVGDW